MSNFKGLTLSIALKEAKRLEREGFIVTYISRTYEEDAGADDTYSLYFQTPDEFEAVRAKADEPWEPFPPFEVSRNYCSPRGQQRGEVLFEAESLRDMQRKLNLVLSSGQLQFDDEWDPE